MEFYTYRLPNGIRGIHRQIRSQVTHCGLLINAGTRDERKGEFGLAHFVEHSLFKGTKKRRAYHINCRLENLGGELNAFTTKEDTTIHATTLRRDFSKAVELISDVAFNSVYPEREIEREREVVYDEINTYKDSPSEFIYDSFEDRVFDGSELGHNILGVKRDISRFDADAIRKFTERCYTTDQMVFSSIGNLSVSRVQRTAEQFFGAIPPSERTFERSVPMPLTHFSVDENHRTHQVHTMLGGRAYSVEERKRLPLALLVNILGGASANSILNMVVRERHALTYNIEANYTPYSDSGIFSIYFGADKNNVDSALELIDKELKGLCNNKITSRKLAMAKRQFLGQLSIAMESNEGYMLGVGKSFLVHNSVDTAAQVEAKLERLTAEEILEVANETFKEYSQLIYR